LKIFFERRLAVMRIKTLLWLFPCVVALAAAACGDDSSGTASGGGGDDGEAGESSQAGGDSKGGSLNAGGGDSGDAGSTMTPEGGSAPTAGADSGNAGETNGGSATGGAGGAGGSDGGNGLDPMSTACNDFPATVELGPTIGLGQTGAILCYHAATEACRLTTNTYSDGENPCPSGDDILFFSEAVANNSVNLPQGWEFVSASDGMLNQGLNNFLNMVPEDTEITAVIKSPDAVEYTVIFTFDGGGQFTITSFSPN
jgi:hypothetical protein